jgi:hypothetical protein
LRKSKAQALQAVEGLKNTPLAFFPAYRLRCGAVEVTARQCDRMRGFLLVLLVFVAEMRFLCVLAICAGCCYPVLFTVLW